MYYQCNIIHFHYQNNPARIVSYSSDLQLHHRVDASTGMREYDELGVVIRP